MTLQQMLYALTIAECGSMNKAAEKLYMVQSTLTSAIRELEQENGITIFVRTHKGMTPTPEGVEFLNDIRNIYRHYTQWRETSSTNSGFPPSIIPLRCERLWRWQNSTT